MKISLDGIKIMYIEQGRADGIPLIFIHGFPFSYKMWEPQLQVLPDSVHAITYDIRGLGESDVGDGQYMIDFFVDDLENLLEHLKISRAILCGLSLGGYIAQRFIQRRPEKVLGLVLSNTKSDADTSQGRINRAATIKDVKRNGVKAFAEGFIKQIFSEKTVTGNPAVVTSIQRIIESTSPLGLCGVQLALASRNDTTEVLPTITIPTLLIAGAKDTFAPPAVMETMKDKIVGSEFHVLPNSAHMSNLEDTEEYNRLLLAFLKKHWQV